MRCSTLSDLLYSGIISARCGGDGEWESLDLSQCTFKELPNKILLLEATDTNIRKYVSLTESLLDPSNLYRECCVLVIFIVI